MSRKATQGPPEAGLLGRTGIRRWEVGALFPADAQAVRPYARQTRARRLVMQLASRRVQEVRPSPGKQRNRKRTAGSNLCCRGRRGRVPAGASSCPWLRRRACRPSPWLPPQGPHAVQPRGTANCRPAAGKPQPAAGARFDGGMGGTAWADCRPQTLFGRNWAAAGKCRFIGRALARRMESPLPHATGLSLICEA